MTPSILRLVLLIALCALPACVSSSDYEHLERQDQLHQLETTNMKKRVESLTRELEKKTAAVIELERQLTTASDEHAAATGSLEAQLAAKTKDLAAVEAKLARVREALTGTTLAKAAARKALLIELMPSKAVDPAPAGEPAAITH